MKLVTITAENANAALAQIHDQLGPDAVVVSVRKLPAHGISRLWHQSKNIEVVAGVPDELPKHKTHAVPPGEDAYVPFGDKVELEIPATKLAARRWRSVTWLESMGLMPVFADQLEQKVCALHGNNPPPMPIAEWLAVRDVLATFWKPARQEIEGSGRPHIFIGPAGSGKTTALCKWMTGAVLTEEHSVRVWRLDGETANVSEFLSLHCELIGVPVARFWNVPEEPADLFFVDFPGVETHNRHALAALEDQITALPNPIVHLVLNAAYESSVLFEQFYAFAALKPDDVIFTHLDEERRRVKLWNFVLGTNCSISFLGAGQKIPGDFHRAGAALLFPH
jgi:flagellar biosynthesis protein FlhF